VTTPLRKLFAIAVTGGAALAALAFLAGCWGAERTAGGDDYPNSVSTLGRTAAEDQNDSTDWNTWRDAPGTPPGVYDSTHVPDSVPRQQDSGMARRAALGDLLADLAGFVPGLDLEGAVRTVDTLSPGAGGERRTVRVQATASFVIRDTTWSAPRAGGGFELRRVSGRLQLSGGGHRSFSFGDGDGDSVLSPRAGSANVARIRMEKADSTGRVEVVLMRVAAGADLDFNARGDNALLQSETLVLQGVDTLLSRVLKPADGGLVIYDPLRDSNRVEVEQAIRRADGSLEQEFYVSVVFADSGRNYPVRYRRVVTAAAGVTETTLLGRDSLPDFAPGDTGRVRSVFESSVSGDTLARSETEFRVRLSDSAGRPAGNRLLRVERHKLFRSGARAATRYLLRLAAPLPDGERPVAGEIELRVELRPSGWILFTGEAASSGFTGTWTNSQGRTGPASFDSLGGRVSPR
jgi:hypothetical protein